MEGDDFGLSGLRWCGGGGESVIFLLLELEMLRMLISDSDSLLESRTKSTNSSKLAGCSATFPDFVFSWKLLDFSEQLSPVPISFSFFSFFFCFLLPFFFPCSFSSSERFSCSFSFSFRLSLSLSSSSSSSSSSFSCSFVGFFLFLVLCCIKRESEENKRRKWERGEGGMLPIIKKHGSPRKILSPCLIASTGSGRDSLIALRCFQIIEEWI